MGGDFTGDGIKDLVVWRPVNGTWYICSSESGFDCSNFRQVQWGLPGDVPINADFDGDSISDMVVWRPIDGTWYIRRSSDDAMEFRQWGLNGDRPMCSSVAETAAFLQR